MCTRIFEGEFQMKHLLLRESDFHQKFKSMNKSLQVLTFLVFYIFFWYTFIVLCVHCTIDGIDKFPKRLFRLSHWSEFTVVIYLLSTAIVMFLTIEKNNEDTDQTSNFEIVCLRIAWVSQNIAINCEILIFIIYWSYLAPRKDYIGFFSISAIGVLPFLTIISTIVSCFPIRFLHFFFACLFLYAHFTVMYLVHYSGIESAIYGPLTDWSLYPSRTAGLGFLLFTFAPLTTNTLCFLVQKLTTFYFEENDIKSSACFQLKFSDIKRLKFICINDSEIF